MGDRVLTFNYSDLRPYSYVSGTDIASVPDDSLFTYKADYLSTSLSTSADWNTNITTTGEFWPYYTYNKSDVEKEITEEINRLVWEGLEHKYLIKSIPKDLLKIKKVKINKYYLINF